MRQTAACVSNLHVQKHVSVSVEDEKSSAPTKQTSNSQSTEIYLPASLNRKCIYVRMMHLFNHRQAE